MDTIFYNGIIHTLDKAYPEVSALAIKDGVILRLGSDEEILALKEPQTRLIDLQGRLMLRALRIPICICCSTERSAAASIW